MKVPEYKVEIIPTSDEAEREMGFEWADESIGTRSKIGGTPDFMQEGDFPICTTCGEAMDFFSQIDSIGDNIVFADVGMLYTFVCFDCFEAISFVQSG
tara:strand:+ start:391 stop:684 length:294 start_codon:yes stop_codon:yes gene_type:complete